jgi:hypothetical protein
VGHTVSQIDEIRDIAVSSRDVLVGILRNMNDLLDHADELGATQEERAQVLSEGAVYIELAKRFEQIAQLANGPMAMAGTGGAGYL